MAPVHSRAPCAAPLSPAIPANISLIRRLGPSRPRSMHACRRTRSAARSPSTCRLPVRPTSNGSGEVMGVWIDTDMGFDDIAAILVVAQSEFEIDGISLVFGNAPLPQVRRNAAGAATAFGWKFPI